MSAELPTADERVMEDWHGSELDTKPVVHLHRAFNGVSVTYYDLSRDRSGETLVFQDMDKLVDWLNHWYVKTNRGAKT
jgi:hypothetical protein